MCFGEGTFLPEDHRRDSDCLFRVEPWHDAGTGRVVSDAQASESGMPGVQRLEHGCLLLAHAAGRHKAADLAKEFHPFGKGEPSESWRVGWSLAHISRMSPVAP